MTVQEILVETQSESVAEAIDKLDTTLSALESGHEGPLAGVYPWESIQEATKRIDNELSILAEFDPYPFDRKLETLSAIVDRQQRTA